MINLTIEGWMLSLRKLKRRCAILTVVLIFIVKIEGIIVRGVSFNMTEINFTCQR